MLRTALTLLLCVLLLVVIVVFTPVRKAPGPDFRRKAAHAVPTATDANRKETTMTDRLRHWLLALGVSLAPVAATAYEGNPAPAAPPFKGDYQVTRWEELIPQDWDPYAPFKADAEKAGAISDTSPEAQALIDKLREVWDSAPTKTALDGASIRLPGYVVPLEESKAGMTEFLLVPYFGACIHSPPPPANQIIHVVSDKPFKNLRSMDAVWVVGTLKIARRNTDMGVSGYRMQVTGLAPYKWDGR